MDPIDQSFLEDKQVDAPSTIGVKGMRRWLYPERRPGPRARLRRLIAVALIIFYFGAPWMQIDGRPLVRVDVLEQKAYVAGLVLKMSEYNYVFFIFAVLGLVLFLVTTLKGRIWCGYACPQTVFVEWIIRPIEEMLEGPAAKRRKQDQGPRSATLIFRKGVKHLLFIMVALVVANAFLGFFVDPYLVFDWITSPPSKHPTAFSFVMFLTGLMYFDLGWFREQFCSFLCPYARFQSVMLDDSSPSVLYNRLRGEPRGKGKDKGDCIDCGLCVRVCPTGIDIRNGLQLECIQCERCVDACNSIMANLKRPTGLLDVTSPSKLSGKSTPVWRRARVYVYSLAILTVVGVGAVRLSNRERVQLTFLRQAGAAYSTLPDGRYSNMFSLRAVNHTGEPQRLQISIQGDEGSLAMICPRCDSVIPPFGEVLTPFLVVFDESNGARIARVKWEGSDYEHSLPIIKKELQR